MLGTFPSKREVQQNVSFCGERITVVQTLLGRLQSAAQTYVQVTKVFFYVGLSWLVIPLAGAAPGVVVGSYSDRDNAQAAAESARRTLRGIGSEVEVHVVSRGAGARVVVLPTVTGNARSLLGRIRNLGFADAWYLAETGVSTATPAAVATRRPVQRAVVAVEKPPQKAETISTPVQPITPKAGAGAQTVVGQEAGVDLHRLSIQTFAEADIDIVIDGKIDEALWQKLPHYDNMLVSIPALVTPAEYATQMRIFATEKGLYVSSDMEQPPESLVKRYSRRDDFINRDTFGVTIDASGESLVAYWFFIALGDSLSDGKVLPERRFQRDWDGPWLGKSAETSNGWSVEFFLPWSMMNMPEVEGPRTIGFAAKRNISATDQSYGWPGYPQFLCAVRVGHERT